MALEEYKRKRDFKQTPEPPAKVGKAGQSRFVVQKHRASRLHYDFRLEMDGVFKSWAVPKGPSLDPADKRLAMQVEDHPVSYFDFEGTIPEGNYGAGHSHGLGCWHQNLQGNARRDAWRKGDLKFSLNGQKAEGQLPRSSTSRSRKPGSKGTEWLLIKHRDTDVQPGYDIDKYDKSVLTSRYDERRLAETKDSAEWTSSNRKAASGRGTSSKNGLAGGFHRKRQTRRKRGLQSGGQGLRLQRQTDIGCSRQSICGEEGSRTKVASAESRGKKTPKSRKIEPKYLTLASIGHKAPMPHTDPTMPATLVDTAFDSR